MMSSEVESRVRAAVRDGKAASASDLAAVVAELDELREKYVAATIDQLKAVVAERERCAKLVEACCISHEPCEVAEFIRKGGNQSQ